MIGMGLSTLLGTSLTGLESVAIVGEQAVIVAEAWAGAGGPPLIVEADHLAVCSRGEGPAPVGALGELPDGSLAAVVLRRAWRSAADVGQALTDARRVVRSGGTVIAAELDVDRLLTGPTARYPARLFTVASGTADRLRATTLEPGFLAAEAVRASLRPVELLPFDEELGTYQGPADLWAAIAQRGWRGSTWVPVDRRGALMDQVAAGLAGAVHGRVVDREPWFAVVGVKP